MSTLEEIQLIELDAIKGLIEKGEIGAPAAHAQPVFSSLTKLRIEKCNKNKMRIPVSGVPNLEVIDISKCEELEEIFKDEGTSSLTLPELKSIRLKKLPRLRKVGILSRAPNLEDIDISRCEEIEEIFEDEGTSSFTLPKVKSLTLHELPRLRKVGILSGVPNLERIYLTRCGEIEDVFDYEGRGCLTLPKLYELYLHKLQKLKSLCKGTTAIICNSIIEINVTECPRLVKKLPVYVDLAVPRHCKIMLNPELWWDSLMSDDPNLSHFFSKE